MVELKSVDEFEGREKEVALAINAKTREIYELTEQVENTDMKRSMRISCATLLLIASTKSMLEYQGLCVKMAMEAQTLGSMISELFEE